MSLLAVLAYPDPLDAIESAVQRWRSQFPALQFAPLPPHFTLVFPTGSVAESIFGYMRRPVLSIPPPSLLSSAVR
jgi:hypothetical protein